MVGVRQQQTEHRRVESDGRNSLARAFGDGGARRPKRAKMDCGDTMLGVDVEPQSKVGV